MTDCVGNEIHEGAILKVFHFVGARRRKHFMYKLVGSLREDGYRKIHHLPMNPDAAYYYKKENENLENSAVVYCPCEFHIYNNLKISKLHGA